MLDHPTRLQAWLADLAAINAALDAGALPPPRPVPKRVRKPKPLWEE